MPGKGPWSPPGWWFGGECWCRDAVKVGGEGEGEGGIGGEVNNGDFPLQADFVIDGDSPSNSWMVIWTWSLVHSFPVYLLQNTSFGDDLLVEYTSVQRQSSSLRGSFRPRSILMSDTLTPRPKLASVQQYCYSTCATELPHTRPSESLDQRLSSPPLLGRATMNSRIGVHRAHNVLRCSIPP